MWRSVETPPPGGCPSSLPLLRSKKTILEETVGASLRRVCAHVRSRLPPHRDVWVQRADDKDSTRRPDKGVLKPGAGQCGEPAGLMVGAGLRV